MVLVSADHCGGAGVEVDVSDKELLAHWMIEHSFSTGHGDTVADLLRELEWQVTELRLSALKLRGESQ